MGKDRFLKELSLSAEVAEAGDAKMETIIGDSESVDRKSSPPAVENSGAIKRESEVPDNAKESTEYPIEQLLAEERVTERRGQHTEIEKEQTTPAQIGESAESEWALESPLFLGKKAADELELGRTTLAASTVLPLSLLGTKKAWVWIVVLICVGVVGYFLWRSHSRKDEISSSPKEEVKTSSGDPVRDYIAKYYK